MSSLLFHIFAFVSLVISSQAATSANGCTIKQIFATTAFNGSESMEYDPMTDAYFVSNNAGLYITKLDPNTNNASVFARLGTLGVPLGLGVRNGVLYAAVGANVVSYNISSGMMIATMNFNSVATMMANFTAVLNGLCINSMGTVVATDVGVNFRVTPNIPTQQNGVYTAAGKITMNPPMTIAPNGCTFKNNKLCVAQFGRFPTVLCADTTAMNGSYTGMNITGGWFNVDGLLYIPEVKMLVASTWFGPAAPTNFLGSGRIMGLKDNSTTWMTLASGLTGPADLGYDSKRNLLLVPELITNKVYTIDLNASSCLAGTTTPVPTTTTPATTATSMGSTMNASMTSTAKVTNTTGASSRLSVMLVGWLTGVLYLSVE